MAFACPGCGQPIARSPEGWALRCPACRVTVRVRNADVAPAPGTRAYDVEVAGRPETRRRVEVPWSDEDARRLRRWLIWSTVLTLGLVVVLLAAVVMM